VTRPLVEVVAEIVHQPVVELRRTSGGDVSQAYRADLADGTSVFVKHQFDAPAGMFGAEAHGLAWLAEVTALRIPAVLGVRDEAPQLLILEWIESGAPAANHDEQLGRGLAALHRAGAPAFGLERDNFVAALPQANAPTADWAAFYVERRLDPLVRRATQLGLIAKDRLTQWRRLFDRMSELCGPPEPPARLHGDLWAGNALVGPNGRPVLIDPAVYGGHREVDLAMMQLFGGFSERVFAAYDEAWPRAEGHRDRVALYQLLPLLVHLVLFGAVYRARLQNALDRYL
jgi:fructosamine-3-kinase